MEERRKEMKGKKWKEPKRDGKIKEGRKETESKINTWVVQIGCIIFAKTNSPHRWSLDSPTYTIFVSQNPYKTYKNRCKYEHQ